MIKKYLDTLDFFKSQKYIHIAFIKLYFRWTGFNYLNEKKTNRSRKELGIKTITILFLLLRVVLWAKSARIYLN